MSQRGRGLLEINPSKNPFYQTTASDIGRKPEDKATIDWDMPKNMRTNATIQQPESTEPAPIKDYGEDFSFLYARSSDVIGGKLETKMGAMAASMDTNPARRKPAIHSDHAAQIPRVERGRIKLDSDRVLAVYKHDTKRENPLYTTAANEYGKKAPSVATFVSERRGRPQEFSNSFNGIKPKNSSLNTSLSKSNVHPSLDPQFM